MFREYFSIYIHYQDPFMKDILFSGIGQTTNLNYGYVDKFSMYDKTPEFLTIGSAIDTTRGISKTIER